MSNNVKIPAGNLLAISFTLADLFPEQSSVREQIALAQLFKSAAIRKQDWNAAAACRDVEKQLKDAAADAEELFNQRFRQATDAIVAAATEAINQKVATMSFVMQPQPVGE